MALRVDDILITDKNVFVMSEGRQMIADIETEATTAEFRNSVAVNPWNLYTDDGRIVSNLYDSAGFDIRTQTLLPNSRLSPLVKGRHDDIHMPNAGKYVGQCQVGDVGYALTDFTDERFVAPVAGNDDYEAGYGFCMYYYLSSVSGGDAKYLNPDLVFNPLRGVQYLNEYPMGRYHSDFGDNELDVEGTEIDRPTVYADTYLTKYFYDGGYSVDGRVVSGGTQDRIDFGGFRTYEGIGHNGDTTYLVYRNDRTVRNDEYGSHRPHDPARTAASFELATVARLANRVAVVTRTTDYAKYAMYSSSDFRELVTPFGKLGGNIFVLASYEPKDESFVLYAATSSKDASKLRKWASEPYRYVTTLVYVPKVGGFDAARTYEMRFGEKKDGGEPRPNCEKLSEMTFIELDSSVLIGTRHNGSFNVVSQAYDYVNTVDLGENAKTGFDPFLQPHLSESPDNRKSAKDNSLTLVDTNGQSDVFYNGVDIVALKHYDKEGKPRLYLSRDYTDSNGRLFTKGCFFSAVVSPEKTRSPKALSAGGFQSDNFRDASVDTVPTDFVPLFDYCPVSLERSDPGFMISTKVFDHNRPVGVNAVAKYAKLSADNVNGKVWSVTDAEKHKGSNCIRVQLQSQWQAEAVLDVSVSSGTKCFVKFNIAIREFFRHLKFTAFESLNSGSWNKVASIDRTKSVIGSEGVGGGEPFVKAGTITFKTVSVLLDGEGTHSVKLRFEDTCDVGPCPYDYALVSGISVYEQDGTVILPPGDASMDEAGNIVLRRPTPLDVTKGSYAFVQFNPSETGTTAPSLGMCKVEDIFRNGGWVGTTFCGPVNSGRVLQNDGKYTEIVEGLEKPTPICTGVQMVVQSGIQSTLSELVKGTPFPLSSYKNIDQMYSADSGLFATYSIGAEGSSRNFSTFTTLPFDRENDASALTRTTIGNREIVIDGVGSVKREYVERYPLDRVVATPVYVVNASTELHDTSVCLVKWNNADGYLSPDSRFNTNDPSQSIAGYHLQYLGMEYDMYIEGSDTKTTVTQTVAGCPNGIKNCRNHPDYTTSVTKTSHNRRGYVYPAPAYYDFRTAGTGLRVFDGPLGEDMKLGDISIIDGYLVVKNYSVGEAVVETNDKGGRTVANPFPAMSGDVGGGYVVAPIRAYGNVKTTADLYETETLLSETASGGTGSFRFLYRMSPKKGIDVYPASVAGVRWKPYYAGKTVRFIEFDNGYYYIALYDKDNNYDIVETDSLIGERPLTKIQTQNRFVSGIRFFSGVVVVEYTDSDLTTTLEWFPQGRISEKRAIGYSEFEGLYGMTPTNVSVHLCAGDVIVKYGNVYGTFTPPKDENSSDTVYADFRMYDETLCDPCIINPPSTSDDPFLSYGVVCTSQNRGNYLVRYSSSEPFSVLDSSFDNLDETVPMSGVHNLFDRRFLVVDDFMLDSSEGNGVHVRAPNGSFSYARRVDFGAGSLSGVPAVAEVYDNPVVGGTDDPQTRFTAVASDVGGDFFSKGGVGGQSNTGFAEVVLTYTDGTVGGAHAGWNVKWKDSPDATQPYDELKVKDKENTLTLVVWRTDDIARHLGVDVERKEGKAFKAHDTVTVRLLRSRTGVEIPLVEMSEGCYKFIGVCDESTDRIGHGDSYCSVVDMTNGDLYVSRNFSDLGGASYECGEVFFKVSPPPEYSVVDGFHIECASGNPDKVVLKKNGKYSCASVKYLHRFPDASVSVDDPGSGFDIPSSAYPSGGIYRGVWKAVGIWRNGVGVKDPPELARTVLFAGKYVCEIGNSGEIGESSNDITEVYHASTKTRSVAFFGSNNGNKGLFSLTAAGSPTYVTDTDIPNHKKIGNAVLFYDSNLSPSGYVEFGQSFSSGANFTAIAASNKSFDKGDNHYDLVDMAGEGGAYYALYSSKSKGDASSGTTSVVFGLENTSTHPMIVSSSGTFNNWPWDQAYNHANCEKLTDMKATLSGNTSLTWSSPASDYFSENKALSGMTLQKSDHWIDSVSFNCGKLFEIKDVMVDTETNTVRHVDIFVPSSANICKVSALLLNGFGASARWGGKGATATATNGVKCVDQQLKVTCAGDGALRSEMDGYVYRVDGSSGWTLVIPSTSTSAKCIITLNPSYDSTLDEVACEASAVVTTDNRPLIMRPTCSKASDSVAPLATRDYAKNLYGRYLTDGEKRVDKKTNTRVYKYRLAESWQSTYPVFSVRMTTASANTKNGVFVPGEICSQLVSNEAVSIHVTGFTNLPMSKTAEKFVSVKCGNDIAAALATSSDSINEVRYGLVGKTGGVNLRMSLSVGGNAGVVGIGDENMLYFDASRNDKFIAPAGFHDVRATLVDERTGDSSVGLEVKEVGGGEDAVSKTYDNVEAVYSLNRFTSNTLHKSNLFGIRIDDLGISDSPYLTDRQKEQLTMWVKNHVKVLVDAVKPAHTELFDVIVD